jgi:hypothetical protein
MARSPRRAPTVHDLEERLTNVERELAQVVSTVTSINQAATSEAEWVRDAFKEHRAEVRNYANCTNMLSLQSSAEYYRCSSICWSELFDHLPNIILRFPSTPPLAQVGEAI